MLTIEHLRDGLTDQKRDLLDCVWRYRLEKKVWPTISIIEHEIDTETLSARDIANSLGGSVIYETRENNKDQYALTLLGVLLSSYGAEAEHILTQYLSYAVKRFSGNPEIENITSDEYVRDLDLTPDISSYTRELVNIGNMWGRSAGFAVTGEWNAGLPSDINRLRFEKDLVGYVHRRALEGYNKRAPSDSAGRMKAFFEDQAMAHAAVLRSPSQKNAGERTINANTVNNSFLTLGSINIAKTPSVFISYSHDNELQKTWVEKLAVDLRKSGVDATFDRWEIGLGDDLAAFMERGVTLADRVIVVCTPRYVAKANAGEGGVGYEKMIVTAELVKNLGTNKFIPLIRNSGGEKQVPVFLGSRLYIDFDDDSQYNERLSDLLRELHRHPITNKPPLGDNPFVNHPKPLADPHPAADPGPAIDTTWASAQRATASTEFAKVGVRGYFEITFALDPPKLAATQPQLMNAARAAEIRTFGWPIGIVLENREEYRPRPRHDGIVANIPILDKQSYDYWALRTNGDFYLLQSLFEDNRAPDKLFFNTRIVRLTEALLYCRRLYSELRVPDSTRVHFITHYGGLKGRELASSNPNRLLFGRKTEEDDIEVHTVFTLKALDEDPSAIVKELLAPVFVLFDFFELSAEVYTDIVNKFINGQVT